MPTDVARIGPPRSLRVLRKLLLVCRMGGRVGQDVDVVMGTAHHYVAVLARVCFGSVGPLKAAWAKLEAISFELAEERALYRRKHCSARLGPGLRGILCGARFCRTSCAATYHKGFSRAPAVLGVFMLSVY